MKRVYNSMSGRESYGQKWQNIEPSSDSESDEGLHLAPVESTETAQVSGSEAPKLESPTIENQIPEVTESPSRLYGESMYRAAVVGDWVAAEELLKQDPNLVRDCVTEEGDRALHVAAAMENKEFVKKLVKRMNEHDLALLDGRGYTACCYAAISGAVEIARVMIEKKPNLVTTHDENNMTPLHKAALRGNKKMTKFLLKLITNIEDLSNEEWFDLLLVTIRRKWFGVAIKMVKRNNYLAMMANEKGTALHLLAQQEISNVCSRSEFILLNVMFGLDADDFNGNKPSDFVELAEKLWAEMLKLGKTRLLELIKKPHILHDAAKAGHVELVTMLIRTYPQLIWDTDSNGYTIFHIAVSYRQRHVFNLIPHANAMIDSRTISQDQDGNNILHLAAKLRPPNRTKLAPAMLMQRELTWFKETEAIVPPSCLEMRNNDGLTPRDLFSKEHRRLLRSSKAWMMNTADSYMLIGTILLTVVFAAAFAVPGGYDGQTGKPILAKRNEFKSFLTYELFGLFGSVFSIIVFRSIMASNFSEDEFLVSLPLKMLFGFEALLISLLSAISAFMSLFLCNGKLSGNERFLFGILYFACFFWFFREIGMVLHYWMNTPRKPNRSSRHTLFK